MRQPKVDIRLDLLDNVFEVLSGLGVVIMILLPAYYYADLPDSIPHHFDAAGEPDAYGNKSILWVLPGVGLLIYLGLSILNRYPHIFNYAEKITENNAYPQYKNATKMLRTLKLIVVLTISSILYVIIQTAMGNIDGLPTAFIIIFPTVILITILYYVFRSMTIPDK